jgi:hypothetical protein
MSSSILDTLKTFLSSFWEDLKEFDFCMDLLPEIDDF